MLSWIQFSNENLGIVMQVTAPARCFPQIYATAEKEPDYLSANTVPVEEEMHTKSARHHQPPQCHLKRRRYAHILAIWAECDSLYSLLTAACSQRNDQWSKVPSALRMAPQYAPARLKNLK
jgi:hypothetical protein